jgi:hypothetical protein
MPDVGSAPDVYADQFIVSVNVWGVALSFIKGPPHPAPGQAPQGDPQATIRMSLEHAKVTAMILKRQLKQYERESGTEIPIPHAVYNAMGLSDEDW